MRAPRPSWFDVSLGDGLGDQPSPRLMGLVLSCACLPTQAITPDNVNAMSLALPKLSPSPNDAAHRTR